MRQSLILDTEINCGTALFVEARMKNNGSSLTIVLARGVMGAPAQQQIRVVLSGCRQPLGQVHVTVSYFRWPFIGLIDDIYFRH
mmetsp:Transcript_1862/g.5817  ORF Transcript_1862/g.5817 Transcript_1862/m.5817 type:complete len:84 (+) Transcript_1862:1116-1367(+)